MIPVIYDGWVAGGIVMSVRVRRRKLSTTISEVSYRYLQSKVESGEASSIAEAADRALERERRLDSRVKLARDTSAYFQSLSISALAEENQLAEELGRASDEVDFGS
jgi:hypothetical protein